MLTRSGIGIDPRAFLQSDMLGHAERLQFERLLQKLRLGLLLAPLLLLVTSGPLALPVVVWSVLAIAASYAWVQLLLEYRPDVLLRAQLALRVVDCALVYVILVHYHADLHNAYYDAAYGLWVAAAAATHGRRGGWLVAGLAGLAVLAGRLQLIAADAFAYELRHMTDPVFYTLLFLALASGVDYLARMSAEMGMRHERAELNTRIDELERVAAERTQSIRLRDALLTGITHDLRNPLTVIRIEARLLSRALAASYIDSVVHIERSAIRMTNWIDELLDTASALNGYDPPLVLEPTDLVQLVRDAIDEYKNVRRHRLVIDVRAKSIAGQFDGPRLERALDNLVANAIKYSPGGGDIRLEVSAGGDWAKVVIRDHGVGIPAQDLPHVFEPFRRGANVVDRIRGTGIGLANARHIVEQHGGALSVESAPGEGSTFIVRLPLEPARI
jgi:signal transduction histidine kinase